MKTAQDILRHANSRITLEAQNPTTVKRSPSCGNSLEKCGTHSGHAGNDNTLAQSFAKAGNANDMG